MNNDQNQSFAALREVFGDEFGRLPMRDGQLAMNDVVLIFYSQRLTDWTEAARELERRIRPGHLAEYVRRRRQENGT
jgi:hypothetical protein